MSWVLYHKAVARLPLRSLSFLVLCRGVVQTLTDNTAVAARYLLQIASREEENNNNNKNTFCGTRYLSRFCRLYFMLSKY